MAIDIDQNRVEFLGIEVIFTAEDDPRGSIWIPFSEELTLLYGKNGAGKSTILRAIEAFISGQSLANEGILVYGFARLKDGQDSCRLMNQAIEDMPNTGFLTEWEELDESELIEKFAATVTALDLPYNKWESSLFAAVPESVEDLDMTWEKFITHFLFLGLWDRDIRHNFSAIKSFIQHLITERTFSLQPTGSELTPSWNFNLAANLDNSEVREAYELTLQMTEYEFMDMELENHVAAILQDLNILSERSLHVRSNSPFVTASRLDSRKVDDIGIATIDLSEEINLTEWTQRRITELSHSHRVLISDPWFSRFGTELSPTQAFVDVQAEDMEVDQEKWSANFKSRAIGAKATIEFQFKSTRLLALQKALTFVANELPSELGISDIRITLEPDLGLWIHGRPGVLEVLDRRSNTWIAVENTSAAMQRIIGMALMIHAEIRSSSKVVVAIGDEIDHGLHSLAIQGLYRMLSESTRTCFVASHSSMALASKFGNRLHVHRGIAGEVLVSSISGTDFSSSSAEKLGIKVNELIGGIEIVLAVEGLHDKIVLEHFLNRDDRFSHTKIHLTSIGGVKNATNLLDIEFILDFTDLRILTVADNVSKTELFETKMNTVRRLSKGEDPARLAHNIRARSKELRKQQWFEQSKMLDLLAMATERGLLDRIEANGHVFADIEMAFPSHLFGLDREWSDLEQEHHLYRESDPKNVLNFKDYLRAKHKISIDRRTIQNAMSKSVDVPTGIQRLLDDIYANIDALRWEISH